MTARLATHRKMLRLAHALGPVLARGTLELLWDYCGENASDRLGAAADIEAIAHWAGEPSALTDHLAAAGFIDPDPSRPGQWIAHDYWDHCPQHIKRKRDRRAGDQPETEPAEAPFQSLKDAPKPDPHGNQKRKRNREAAKTQPMARQRLANDQLMTSQEMDACNRSPLDCEECTDVNGKRPRDCEECLDANGKCLAMTSQRPANSQSLASQRLANDQPLTSQRLANDAENDPEPAEKEKSPPDPPLKKNVCSTLESADNTRLFEEISIKPLKEKKAKTSKDAEKSAEIAEKIPLIVEIWRKHCVKIGLANIQDVKDQRKSKLCASLLDSEFPAKFEEACIFIATDPDGAFHRGETAAGTWRADFDWLIDRRNVQKILERKTAKPRQPVASRQTAPRASPSRAQAADESLARQLQAREVRTLQPANGATA